MSTLRAVVVMSLVFVVGAVVGSVIVEFNTPHFDVNKISYSERLNDLNNENARNRFCQAAGYQSASVVEVSLISGLYPERTATNPFSYRIYCSKKVDEHEIYSYEDYKKFLISLEIRNVTRGN